MTPARPDPKWIAVLKEGDKVAVAERGRAFCECVVLKRTSSGLLKVGSPGEALRDALVFYGDPNAQSPKARWHAGYQRDDVYGSRYLVPVESAK